MAKCWDSSRSGVVDIENLVLKFFAKPSTDNRVNARHSGKRTSQFRHESQVHRPAPDVSIISSWTKFDEFDDKKFFITESYEHLKKTGEVRINSAEPTESNGHIFALNFQS